MHLAYTSARQLNDADMLLMLQHCCIGKQYVTIMSAFVILGQKWTLAASRAAPDLLNGTIVNALEWP